MNIILERKRYFKWRERLSIKGQISLMLLFTILTGISALIKIPLGFTPVPVTAQTLVVLLSGVFLTRKWAVRSQLLYIAMGISGVKWFSGGRSGVAVLSGATGGYLLGFIAAAYLVAYIRERHDNDTNFQTNLILMFTAGLVVIFGFGLLQLNIWFKAVKGSYLPIRDLLNMGLNPFIAGELIKISIAVFAANLLRNK